MPANLLVAALALQSPVISNLPGGLVLETYPSAVAAAKCPKYGWEYPFMAKAYVPRNGAQSLAFEIRAQSAASLPLVKRTGVMLLRLWQLCSTNIGIDHPIRYGSVVHVYLAEGGKAGGEQAVIGKLNCIYIYHVEDFTNPVEMAREVAHEYGHAILPAIGGFRSPEDWGNGFLGEKLFLSWVDDAMQSGELSAEDAMGAAPEDIRAWVAKYADPLSNRIWRSGPDGKLLAKTGAAAMNEYIGLMLYVSEAFPNRLGRAMVVSGGQTAPSALQGVLDAVHERSDWTIDLPDHVRGDFWVPIEKASQIQGATVVLKDRNGMKLRPFRRKIVIRR
jgi:hypothetical protein